MENKLNEDLNELNILQQRLHIFDTQSRQMEFSIKEIETSITEASKVEDKVYSIIGSIMIPKDPKEVIKDLELQKTQLSANLVIINKQIEKLSKKSEEIQSKIQESLKDEKSN
ncbi:MAG: prefoldin subunit [Candidatus Woesearchaeota archaeon]